MKKKSSAFSKNLAKLKRKIRFLKFRFFLLVTLPVAVATIAQAVIKEYSRIKIRKIGTGAKTDI